MSVGLTIITVAIITFISITAAIFFIKFLIEVCDGDRLFGDAILWRWFAHWLRFRKYKEMNNLPCFSYKQITKFYNTAPKKWHIAIRNFVVYRHNYLRAQEFPVITYLQDNQWTDIGVKTMIDYLLIQAYIKNAEKKEQERKNTLNRSAEMTKLVMSFNADAKNAQNEANRLIKEQEETVSKILATLSQTEQAGN